MSRHDIQAPLQLSLLHVVARHTRHVLITTVETRSYRLVNGSPPQPTGEKAALLEFLASFLKKKLEDRIPIPDSLLALSLRWLKCPTAKARRVARRWQGQEDLLLVPT